MADHLRLDGELLGGVRLHAAGCGGGLGDLAGTRHHPGRVLDHPLARAARHKPRLRRVLPEHPLARAGVLLLHGRPPRAPGHPEHAEPGAPVVVRHRRGGRGPLPRGVHLRGYPHGHRGGAPRPDGGGALAGLLARAGVPLRDPAADLQGYPAAAVQPGAQPGEEHVGARAHRRWRPHVQRG